jgi:bacterioferritin-associated ferredoxin
MYICICKGITEKMLNDSIGTFNRSEEQILKNLGIGDSCGSCVVDALKKILDSQNKLDSKNQKSDS